MLHISVRLILLILAACDVAAHGIPAIIYREGCSGLVGDNLRKAK